MGLCGHIRYDSDTHSDVSDMVKDAHLDLKRLKRDLSKYKPFEIRVVQSYHWASEGIWVEWITENELFTKLGNQDILLLYYNSKQDERNNIINKIIEL